MEIAEAHPASDVVLEDHPDDRGALGVGLQDLLFAPLSGLVRVRMWDLSELVPIERLASGVASLPGGRLDSLTGLHLQLVQVAPGEPHVHVAKHDGPEGFLPGLIDRPQLHVGLSELLLDAKRDRGVPGHAAD
ncbi:MAG TPA: hypothetical protein VGL16_08560 [Actinomycetota bacterium]